MKLLLLGRNGQVGSALMTYLAGKDVAAFGRDGANLERPWDLEAVVTRERPDVIINAAAYTAVDKAESEPERARLINAISPGKLAELAAVRGAWLIHYSTDYVFDGRKSDAYVETDATAPLGVYGETKRDGEIAIARVPGRHLIFRTSWVHAPGGGNFVAKILQLAAERTELKVIDDQIGAPTSAGLIAQVTMQAVSRIAEGRAPAPGVYHLTASGQTSWNSYARFVLAEAALRGIRLKADPSRVMPVPSSAFATAAQRPLNSRLATSKIRAALGIDLPDWRDGVARTLDAMIGASTAA
jgi:dTDP-4-dehydrorhamnose reductase